MELAAGAEDEGLFDESYSCYRCHQLGSTEPAADGQVVPNPAATNPAAPDTAKQWARDPAYSVADFMSDPAASYDGLGIQCENCHGTGVEDATGHGGGGTQIVTNLETLGQSQVCGQCHGSYSTVAGTLGIIGYTVNLPCGTSPTSTAALAVVHQDPDRGRVPRAWDGFQVLHVPERQQRPRQPLLLQRVGRDRALVPRRPDRRGPGRHGVPGGRQRSLQRRDLGYRLHQVPHRRELPGEQERQDRRRLHADQRERRLHGPGVRHLPQRASVRDRC